MAGPPAQDGPVREQLSALRSMLVLAMLLTQQDSQDSILHYVANAVESLGSCTTEGIFLDGRWMDIRLPRRRASSLPALTLAVGGGPVTLADVPWAWRQYAYRGYLALQELDRRLLESRLPPAIFYNLMLSARKGE